MSPVSVVLCFDLGRIIKFENLTTYLFDLPTENSNSSRFYASTAKPPTNHTNDV